MAKTFQEAAEEKENAMTQPTDWLEQAKREIAQEHEIKFSPGNGRPFVVVKCWGKECGLSYLNQLEAQMFDGLIAERARNLELRERLKILLPNVSQLLDGWHADGTAWSEWDESVRKEVSEMLAKLESV
jgi:hypothetical protein